VLLLVGFLACSRVALQGQPNIGGFLVNGVASSTGPVGATLTIQGTGFGSPQGFSTATLNGTYLAGNGVRPISWSSTSIVATIPNTASSGPVIVKVLGRGSLPVTFSIGAVITGVSPGTALAGSAVTISGNGFGTSVGTVTFNGTTATTTSWNDSSIVANVPNTATPGPIVVTVNGVASNGVMFTPTPAITSLSPNSGLSGATVTIAGNSFGTQTGTVTFNGVSAAVSGWNNTSITVAAPSGALTGNVVVTVNGVASAGQMFTYTPQITGVSPNPGLADSPVSIQGLNFGGQQNTSTVTFNGVAAAVTSWNNTSIATTVPGTATAGAVVVTVNGVASNGVGFAFPGLYSFSVGYAPNGDVLTANDSVNGSWAYTYDDFNRLATSNNSNPQQGYSYSYDQYGNFWQQNVTAGSGRGSVKTFTAATAAFSNGNCYHGAGQTNQPDGYCYDAVGNLLSDGQHSYVYDAENRIIQVDGGQTASYVYDGDGNRIQKVSGTGTAAYLYDLGGHVIAEVNGAGVWTRGEVYVGGQHVATYGNGSQGTTYLVQADWLGTERERLLPNGDVFETCTSLPFGDGLNCNGAADPSPNHMTGKERDSETGLDFFGARYYSNQMGRFVTPDPLLSSGRSGDPQTWNRYAYVRNNPIGRIDPSGLYDFKNTCGTNDKDCNAAFAQTQTNVRNAYKATQTAYDKAVASGDKDAAAALKRTLDGLGAEGQKNARGQTVNISVNLGLDASGQTNFAKGSTTVINVVLNPSRSNGEQDREATVAHEGVHAGEIKPGKPTWNEAYTLEQHAYETQSYFDQAIGFEDMRSPADGSDMKDGVLDLSKEIVLYSPSWAGVDAATVNSLRSKGVNAAAKDGADKDCQNGGCRK